MIKKIDHIAVAVENIEESARFYTEGMGLTVTHIEEVPSQKVKVAFIPVGEVMIELLEPTSEDSPVAKYLAKRGKGLHHVAYAVDDIHAAMAHLESQGARLIDKTPRPGAHGKQIAFLHPKSSGGVLTELCQK